jgi:hypothetical protein
MPRQRTPSQQLVRQFSAADRPIYLVDDQHVIVYCNPACAAWARVPEEELVGQTCVYGLPADDAPVTSAAAAAARLCPTPGLSARRGCVSAIDERGELVFRQAEFLPLSAGTGTAEFSVEGPALADDAFPGGLGTAPAGLLVLVDLADMLQTPGGSVLGSDVSPDGDDPAAEVLHAELAHWRHRLAGRYRLERMVGSSSAAARVRAQVSLAAAAPVAVLIVGPPGSGKEHVAKAIHYRRLS